MRHSCAIIHHERIANLRCVEWLIIVDVTDHRRLITEWNILPVLVSFAAHLLNHQKLLTQVLAYVLVVLAIFETLLTVNRFGILWAVSLYVLWFASAMRVQIRGLTILSIVTELAARCGDLFWLWKVGRRHNEIVRKGLYRIWVLDNLVTIIYWESLDVIIDYIWELCGRCRNGRACRRESVVI